MIALAVGLVSGVIGGLVFVGVVEVTLLRVCMVLRTCSEAGVTDVDGSDAADSDGVTWATWPGCVPSGAEGMEGVAPPTGAETPELTDAVVGASPRIGPAAAWRSLLVFTSAGTCSVTRKSCSTA